MPGRPQRRRLECLVRNHVIAVTLLIPCYNAAAFLPRLMTSVRAQTRPFTHILCYDDGSKDDTLAVARELGVEIIAGNPNRGVAYARNRLAAAAQTEWIHFHDADDRIAPEFVESLAPLCTDDIDVVFCDADWIDEADSSLHVAWRYRDSDLSHDAAAHLLANPLGLNSSIVRREAWRKLGGCDESLAIWEDADVHFRLALNGARFRHLPQVLTWSLRRDDSFSHDYRRNWRCRVQALEGYATDARAAHLRPLIGAEAENAAVGSLQAGDPEGAKRAVSLCGRLGYRVPATHNPLLRAIGLLLPGVTALRLRQWIRRHSAATPRAA